MHGLGWPRMASTGLQRGKPEGCCSADPGGSTALALPEEAKEPLTSCLCLQRFSRREDPSCLWRGGRSRHGHSRQSCRCGWREILPIPPRHLPAALQRPPSAIMQASDPVTAYRILLDSRFPTTAASPTGILCVQRTHHTGQGDVMG